MLLHLVRTSDPVISAAAFLIHCILVADGLHNGEAVSSALCAAEKLVIERHEGCVTYWHFRASNDVAPLPSETPPYGSTYSSVHGKVSNEDEDMVRRRQGEDTAISLFLP